MKADRLMSTTSLNSGCSRDIVGNEPAVDANPGLALAQILQRVARQSRSDAPMPTILIHVGVRERHSPAGGLVRQVADDLAIDQRLVQAGGPVLAHLEGRR